jgi:hypothetical protein
LTKSVLAAVAAVGLLAGCATYDYGYGYTYSEPYGYTYTTPYAYGYDYGPYYYDYGYGPSYYSGPSIGFTFRDSDRHYRHYRNHRGEHRNYSSSRNDRRSASTRPTVTHPQRNVAPAGSRSRPVAPPATARNDPWGGTNNPYARNSQQ